MDAMKATTAIVNSTNHVLKLKVGSHQHYAELATIEKQGHHDLHFNVNETYREFLLQAVGGSNDKSVIVTSDDCCDNECITIKEADSGKFGAHRVPRKRSNSGSNHGQEKAEAVTSHADSEVKLSLVSRWLGWLRQLWSRK